MDLLNALSAQAAFINTEVVPWALRLVMVALGLSLTVADFKRVVAYPRAVGLGLFTQLVGTPILGFGLALLFNAPPAIAIGLIILAACPSGVTANAYTFASRADVPLCVTLSALTSVVTAFTVPFVVNVGLDTFDIAGEVSPLSPSRTLIQLMGFTALPLAIGMIVRAVAPTIAERAVEPIRKVVLYLMICVLMLVAVASHQVILASIVSAGALVILLNVLSMALGYGIGRLFKLPMRQVVTLTFEVGVHNLTLALTIAYVMLQRPEFAVAALLYSPTMSATALLFVRIAKRLIAAEEEAASATASGSAAVRNRA